MKKFILMMAAITVLSCGNTKIRTINEKQVASNESAHNAVDEQNENFAAQDSVNGEIEEGEIEENQVKEYITFLASDDLKGRNTGTPGIAKAADYLSNQLKNAGIQPFFDQYRDVFEVENQEAFNVVGVLEGSDAALKNEYIVLGAHYDHIGIIEAEQGDSIANGANDDASGTTAVLTLANYFARHRTKRSILFAFFTAEEKGLLGSKNLAKRLKNQNLDIKAMFNIEMIGVPMQNKDHLAYLTGYENSNMAAVFNTYSGKKVLGFLPQAQKLNLFKRSDNYAFYEELGVPAQTVSTFDFTNFNHYHKVGDEVEKLDIPFMTRLINNLIPGVEGMANATNDKIKWNE